MCTEFESMGQNSWKLLKDQILNNIIIIITSHKSPNETTFNKCKFYFSCYINVQDTKEVQYIAKAVVFTRREATTVLVEALQICSYLCHSTCNSNCKFIKIQSCESP